MALQVAQYARQMVAYNAMNRTARRRVKAPTGATGPRPITAQTSANFPSSTSPCTHFTPPGSFPQGYSSFSMLIPSSH